MCSSAPPPQLIRLSLAEHRASRRTPRNSRAKTRKRGDRRSGERGTSRLAFWQSPFLTRLALQRAAQDAARLHCRLETQAGNVTTKLTKAESAIRETSLLRVKKKEVSDVKVHEFFESWSLPWLTPALPLALPSANRRESRAIRPRDCRGDPVARICSLFSGRRGPPSVPQKSDRRTRHARRVAQREDYRP